MNPNLALFAQMANRQQMPSQMMGPQGMQLQGPATQMARSQAPQQPRLTPQEMAAMGRFGDRIVAHLTPGEIEVPPQVQTPKVLATLKKAFEKKGAPAQNFVAGSPTSSINPNTGAPEYNLLASLLPIAGTVAGAAFGGPMGAAAGGALGGAIGGEMNGGGTSGALSGALMGGGLGYFGGTALGGAFPGTFGGAAGAASAAAPLQGPLASGATLDTTQSGLSGAWNALAGNKMALLGGIGGLGGLFSSGLSNGTSPGNTYRPPGFNTPLTPMNQLGTPNQQLGVGMVPQRTLMAPANPATYGYGPGQQLVA